jgi:dipeptidase E
MVRALLLSNSTNHGQKLLEHAHEEIARFLSGRRKVVFFPYAMSDHAAYVSRVRDALDGVCEIRGGHDATAADLLSADAFFVGGGNTWRLLASLHEVGLIGLLRRRIKQEGVMYIGSSAGTNVACPTIRTTNDMPIVEPPTFAALNIVPFQINAHYIDGTDTPTHMGESRETRLKEFLEVTRAPVVALREGCWLHVEGAQVAIGGTRGARLFLPDREAQELSTGMSLDALMLDTPGITTV